MSLERQTIYRPRTEAKATGSLETLRSLRFLSEVLADPDALALFSAEAVPKAYLTGKFL